MAIATGSVMTKSLEIQMYLQIKNKSLPFQSDEPTFSRETWVQLFAVKSIFRLSQTEIDSHVSSFAKVCRSL